VIFTVSTGLSFSLTSLGLLVVVYTPYCFSMSPRARRLFPDVLEYFQKIMVIIAPVCLAQFAAQFVGWQFRDLLDFLPENMLAHNFNTSYTLYYGSSIYKSNGIIFLEPSFASQLLALAIIIQLVLGGRRGRILLFVAALLTTFSGTGMILLVTGLLVLAVRRGGRWLWRMVVTVALAAIVLGGLVGGTEAAGRFLSRATELSEQGSSGNSRFVAPYEVVFGALSTDPAAMLVGRGAGSLTSDLEYFSATDIAASYPALPKLLGEYGMPATMTFLMFLLTVFFLRVRSITLAVMVCMLFFFLSGALLEPQIVYLSWLLTALFAGNLAVGANRHTSDALP